MRREKSGLGDLGCNDSEVIITHSMRVRKRNSYGENAFTGKWVDVDCARQSRETENLREVKWPLHHFQGKLTLKPSQHENRPPELGQTPLPPSGKDPPLLCTWMRPLVIPVNSSDTSCQGLWVDCPLVTQPALCAIGWRGKSQSRPYGIPSYLFSIFTPLNCPLSSSHSGLDFEEERGRSEVLRGLVTAAPRLCLGKRKIHEEGRCSLRSLYPGWDLEPRWDH